MAMKEETGYPELTRICRYCEHASLINDECNVLCEKKGIVNNEYCCRKFLYDPLKRVPAPPPPIPKLTEDDIL